LLDHTGILSLKALPFFSDIFLFNFVIIYKAVCADLQITAGDNKTLPCDYNADACCTDIASLLPVNRHQL